MRIAAIAIAALAAGLSPADGASLRQTTTLQVLRARHAEGKTPKTAYNGEKFHSILDHPSTAHFFEGKDEAEITDMVESAVFAHFVGHGHSLHKKKKARVNEAELASSSFVQLAAAHGVDFKTLKALHKKSGKGHHDMEIWWREQALHASVHVDNGPNVGPEDELRASVSPLELSFMEVFQAETADKKTRAAKTATASVTAKATMAMASNAVTAPQVTGEETTATTTRVYAEARAKVVRVAQDTKAETKASRALDDASDTAFLSEKTLQGEDQKLLKKMSTLSEAKIRAHLKVKVGNGLGDRCGWSCDDGSPCTSHKCTYHAASRSGNQHCYCNVDCSSGTCIGNGGTCQGDGGHCMYDSGTISDHSACSKNDECASGRCIGNGGGLLSSLGARGAGTCDYQDASRAPSESCNKNANCGSNRCIGNGGGLLSSIGALDAGYCDYPDASRAPSQSCNKNDNCASSRCVGNGGGLLSSFGASDAGFCDYHDQSRQPEQTCNKNDNCRWGNCIGNGGGLLSSFGARDAGKCGFRDASRGGTCSCANLRTPDELSAYSSWLNARPTNRLFRMIYESTTPKPTGFDEYQIKASQAAEVLITRARCQDELLCTFTHVYQTCNNNAECKSNQCDGNGAGACPIWACGHCASEPGTILPWEACATDEECMSDDCDFANPLSSRGYCTLDHPRRAKSSCRCQKDTECLSGTCAGPIFDQNEHRCTAETGTTLAGEACQRNNECESGTCEGNVWGATDGECAGPYAVLTAGASGTPTSTRLHTAQPITERIRSGQTVVVSAHGAHASCRAASTYHTASAVNVGDRNINLQGTALGTTHRMAAGDACKVSYFEKKGLNEFCQHNSFCDSNCCQGNKFGLTEGICKVSSACVSGLAREAGRWIADVIKEGLTLLAGGLIKVLRWILAAAESIFAMVATTAEMLHSTMANVKELVIAMETHCPRAISYPYARPDTTACLDRAEQLTTRLASADKMKQMMQYKAAVVKSKVTSCQGATETGETCTPRNSGITNALGAWAPQYWADTMGVGFRYFNADIHKILDFQTMEYGYASDLGITVDTDLIEAIAATQNAATLAATVAGFSLGDFSASVSSNVGWKGRNRGNWKNLRDGYTGDAFGISASLPIKPLDAGVFSIDGGVSIGIQSDFKCSFLDNALNFVGTMPEDLPNENCPNGPGYTPAAIANDIANSMFVWKGTKTIGVSLSAEYSPPVDADVPTDPAEAAADAAEAAAGEAIGLTIDAGISQTKIFKQYGGCFGPEPRVDGQQHSEADQVGALVDMLGYMWMGQDQRMEPVGGSSWFVQLAEILTHLTSSSAQLPSRVIQSVLAVVQHVTTRGEMPGNCGCMWCRASNLGECIPCTVGVAQMTKDTCRLRHWCKATPNSHGQCFAMDYTGNFALERLTHSDIQSSTTCKNSIEAGASAFVREGKCMLKNACLAIIPEKWEARGHSHSQALTDAQTACSAAEGCTWQVAHHRCISSVATSSTSDPWVDLEEETTEVVASTPVPLGGTGNGACQSGCSNDNGCSGDLTCFVRSSDLVRHYRTETYCASHHDVCSRPTQRCTSHTQTCGPAPCLASGFTSHRRVCVRWFGCHNVPTGWGCTRRGSPPCVQTCSATVTDCPTPKTTGNGWDLNVCAQTATRQVENIAPCPPDDPTCPHPPDEQGNPDANVQGCSGTPVTATNYCIDPSYAHGSTVAHDGLVFTKQQCENSNYGGASTPSHLWAHTFMPATQIVHNKPDDGGASNGIDAISRPNHTPKHPADPPPVPVLAHVASGTTEMSEQQDTNNQGALKRKIDHVLEKLSGLSNPDATPLLNWLSSGVRAVQEKIDEVSQSGTTIVAHRAIDAGEAADEAECYEEMRGPDGNLLHPWPY